MGGPAPTSQSLLPSRAVGSAAPLGAASLGSEWAPASSIDTAVRLLRANVIAFPADLTPPQITANQNDYGPVAWEQATVIRLSSNGNYNITGHAAPLEGADGRILIYRNVNALGGGTLTLVDESALSVASSRWAFPGGNLDVAPLDGAMFIRDVTSDRWFILGDPVGPVEVAGSITAVKTADESLASDATLNNDADLVIAVAANSRYSFELYIVAESASALPEIDIAFTGPAGSTVRYSMWSINEDGAALDDHADAGGTELLVDLPAALAAGIHVLGTIVVAGTAGNLQFQWAQNVSNATAVIVREGGWLIAHKLS